MTTRSLTDPFRNFYGALPQQTSSSEKGETVLPTRQKQKKSGGATRRREQLGTTSPIPIRRDEDDESPQYACRLLLELLNNRNFVIVLHLLIPNTLMSVKNMCKE